MPYVSEENLIQVKAQPSSSTQHRPFTAEGFARFPEVFGTSRTRYEGFSVWLFRDKGVLNPNVRDTFSAGGKVDVLVGRRIHPNQQRIIGELADYRAEILDEINAIHYRSTSGRTLLDGWMHDLSNVVGDEDVVDLVWAIMTSPGDVHSIQNRRTDSTDV